MVFIASRIARTRLRLDYVEPGYSVDIVDLLTRVTGGGRIFRACTRLGTASLLPDTGPQPILAVGLPVLDHTPLAGSTAIAPELGFPAYLTGFGNICGSTSHPRPGSATILKQGVWVVGDYGVVE